MTFAQKLGASYVQHQEQVKIKSIKCQIGEAEFTLRVRIPIKREMEAITESITNPDPDRIEATFNRLAEPIKKAVADGGEELVNLLNTNKEKIVITEADVILDGTSVRQTAHLMAMWEIKVEQMFHLLQSETGEPINESYEQIIEEFPESVIKMLVDEIEQTIKPDYRSAKKN